MPLIDFRAIPWRLNDIPMFANEKGFPKTVLAVLAISLCVVCALWLGFTTSYETTRDIYFAFAMAHVLAEMPFLIKML
jgi:multidrug resistance efflux pump